MSNHTAELLQASFVQGAVGKLFCIRSLPRQPKAAIHNVIFVPSFAEELNTSRRFNTLLRRKLNDQGYTVIQPDLYGTGDSEGLFQEATWDTWLVDLQHVFMHYFGGRGEKTTVVALRSGCILAQEFLKAHNSLEETGCVEKLVYLQPETSGFDVINTLLRMQVASNRLSGNSSETSALLWQRFEQGQNLLIAGYDIGNELALQMRDKHLLLDATLLASSQEWINLAPGTEMASPIAEWHEHAICSNRFWQSHDIEPDSQTIEDIVSLIDG